MPENRERRKDNEDDLIGRADDQDTDVDEFDEGEDEDTVDDDEEEDLEA
jgi:hypothetical protein